MATVYVHTNDGYVARFNQLSWSSARANTAGTSAEEIHKNEEKIKKELSKVVDIKPESNK